jgi:hypothetical protein
MIPVYFELAERIAEAFSQLPQVESVALGGSMGSFQAFSDPASDIDLYIFTRQDIPIPDRQLIMEKTGGSTLANIGLNYWGPGDEWLHRPTGIEIDIVYFDMQWMSNQLEQVVIQHNPAMGYTTCFWFTLMNSAILFDPRHWLADLREKYNIPYPDLLRKAIVEFNHPVLREIIPAYSHQLEKAVKRVDLVSVNHRLAALLASYFDILFAVNRQLHPGEKRLVQQALMRCPDLPQEMSADLDLVFSISSDTLSELPLAIDRLLEHLDEWLRNQNLLVS